MSFLLYMFPERIKCKVARLTYRAKRALHHHTWSRHPHVPPTCRTDAGSGPPPLNGMTFQPAVSQQSEIVLCRLLVKRCRTACQAMSHHGGVQKQAQYVLVPLLLRNCMTRNDNFLFLVIISPPVQWSYQ